MLEPETLFAPLAGARCVLVAVSGGVDSTALLALLAEWGRVPVRAATVDHGLRPESRAEAERVAALCARLGVPHAILDWTGEKPATGIEEAARAARYGLLAEHAHAVGADVLVTAHTLDDQAETVLMRLAAGSGPAGLAGMRAEGARAGLRHVRPLLATAKAELTAFAARRGLSWSEDAMNRDHAFARPRLRAARAALAREGLTARRLATLAARMARLDAALEAAVEAAAAALARPGGLDAAGFHRQPAEIRLRLIERGVRAAGQSGRLRLERLERLEAAIAAAAGRGRGRWTLGGAVITLGQDAISFAPAPPRRNPSPATERSRGRE